MKKTTIGAIILSLTLATTNIASAASADKGCYDGYIGANDQLYYTTVFEGEERAKVDMVAYQSDVDIYIYDENGNEVCKSTSNGSVEWCYWTPRWTGSFEIRVENLRKRNGSDFELCLN